MRLVQLVVNISMSLLIAVSGDIIGGQYVISFDSHCLAVSYGDVINKFFRIFTCYHLNTELVDLYPNIGDYFIVVNNDPFCYDNPMNEPVIGEFCINTIEQDFYTTDLFSYKSSECDCTSRNVDPFVLYNLDSLTPQVNNGFELMICPFGYDPGFDIIVMDSGINGDHEEFDGIIYQRIFDAYPHQKQMNRHGTHVAGIILGQTFGAFKAKNTKVKLLDFKYTDEFGNSVIIDRINGFKSIVHYLQTNPTRKAIVNFSFGSTLASDQYDPLLAMIRQNGGIMFAGAGNSKSSSCSYSPASSADTFTVGAVNRNFERWISSNYGECVNTWAPGVNITSAYVLGGSVALTGTSMATPLVAGVAANILIENPQFSFDDIKGKLLSTFGAVFDINFERPDVTVFPAPVVNQPRIQGSCGLYVVSNGNNMYENNAYGTNNYRNYGYKIGRHGYNGHGNNEYEANGYNYKHFHDNKEYERSRYVYNGYGNNKYEANGYNYKRKKYGYNGHGNNERRRHEYNPYGNNKYERNGYNYKRKR